MKIRKTLVVGLALSMVATLGLSGCGSNSDVEKTADGKVKITMWHGFSEADGKTLESIVKDFNKSQDKYEIDAQLQPWSTIGETMVTRSLPVMVLISSLLVRTTGKAGPSMAPSNASPISMMTISTRPRTTLTM